MKRALLVLLRDPGDPMADHEHTCFAVQSGLPREALTPWHMAWGPPGQARIDEHDVVFFGGSGAYSVLDNEPFIHQAMDLMVELVGQDKPSYASCFGFQGLALALGGEVIRDDERTEMGTVEMTLTTAGTVDPVFGVLPRTFAAQQGHHDRVSRLPSGVVRMAQGELCPEQAFRVEGARFWASQFHPELTRETTLDRFRHYRDHYLTPDEAEPVYQFLQSRPESSPEVDHILRRVLDQA